MRHLLTILSLCFTAWAVPDRSRAEIPFLDMDLNEVREMAGQKGSLYFAFFTADWCAPCRWMEDQTFLDHRLNQYVSAHYLAVRVDIDQRQGRIHQERFQVKLLPSILVFNAQGQLLARIETALSGDELLQILREHDLPKNRIGSTPANYATQGPVMDSPKPQIRLYRSPLPTEGNTNAPPAPAALPSPVVISNNRIEPSNKVPEFKPERETLVPRSERTFSIQVAAHKDYDQAVRQVAQLESGFQEPVQLLGASGEDGEQIFRIFIGQFVDRKVAEDYLYYLRRKNMNGIIKDMNAERE